MSAVVNEAPHAPQVRWRFGLLAAVAIAATAAMLMQERIPQPAAFHRFADARTLLGVPNFWNIASNLVFLVVGVLGLLAYSRAKPALDPALRPAYLKVLFGAVLVCLGSSWYHLAPDTPRLTWDRLPITLAFIGLFCVVIGEYLKPEWGRRLLVPLTLILFRPGRMSGPHLWGTVGIFVVAKAFETFDRELLEITGLSGHTWKHVAAGAAVYLFVPAMRKKRLAPG